jgi:hypothetical protein
LTHPPGGRARIEALSEALAQAGSPARELVVDTDCNFTGSIQDWRLTAIDFRARGSVPEIDERAFQDAALTARHQSLRAAGMREDLPGDTEATLES